MDIVDSHCHIDFPQLADDLDGVLNRAEEAGVRHLLCVSVNMEDFPRILDLSQRFPQVFASCGVHPNTQDQHEPTLEELVALGSDPRVVAIGETGLDYYRSEGDLDWQRARFSRHIGAARQLGKPLIIHTRQAADDTLARLKDDKADEVGGVMHCFSENWDVAKAALDLGFYISLSGIVTFRSAETLRDVARRVPDDRLLIETDSPYLAPVPHRGKTNEPAWVRHVAECVADVRNEPAEHIAEITTENFFRLFATATPVSSH